MDEWAVLGDSFPVGCAPDMVGLPDSKKNLDHSHPLYGTKNGIYQSGCGISNLMMSWGKDEQLDSTQLDITRHNCSMSFWGLTPSYALF